MSSLARWSYTQPLTVWPVGTTDEWGQPSLGVPCLITGSWSAKSETMTNADGREFVSRSVYYLELPDGDPLLPKRGAFIKRGDHTSLPEPPSDAEKIESVNGYDMAMFGSGEIPDWEVVT